MPPRWGSIKCTDCSSALEKCTEVEFLFAQRHFDTAPLRSAYREALLAVNDSVTEGYTWILLRRKYVNLRHVGTLRPPCTNPCLHL